MNAAFVHGRAIVRFALAALCLPLVLTAGELRTKITSLSKTCVGQELTVNATVEDFNATYAVHNVVTTVKIMQGATVVGTKTLSPFDLTPTQVKALEIATGWIPTASGAYTVNVSADGTDDINGPQADQASLTVCENSPCPDRPSASGTVIYLGPGSTGSITYTTPRPECCFELKLTIVTGRDVITQRSPEVWTPCTSSTAVSVTVDRSKWTTQFLTLRLDWRTCDHTKEGSDYILVRAGDKPQASAPQTPPPPGVTSGQTTQSGTVGDPVVTSTRELVVPVQVIDMETISKVPVSIERQFASLAPLAVAKEDGFGPGWSSNLDWFVVPGDGEAYVYAPNNAIYRFLKQGSSWVRDWPLSGAYAFAQPTDSTYVFADLKSSMVMGFDAGGRLRFFDNSHGYRNTVNYTGRFISSVTTPSLRGLTFVRDSVGRITSATNGVGTVQYGYTNGMLSSFVDARGNTTLYNYVPGTSYLTSWRTPEGRTPFTVSYDATGHVTSQDFGDGFIINFGTSNGVTTMTYPLGITRTHTHDAQQRLTGLTNSTGGSATFGYDAQSNRNLVKDMEGGTVARTYTNGLLSNTTLGNGSKVSIAYTARPYLGITMQDLKSIEVLNGPKYQFDYNVNGTLKTFTMPSGVQTSFTYGTGWDPIRITGNGRDDQFTYDADGLVSTMTSSTGTSTTYVRDAAGYVTEERQASTTIATYGYDADHNVLSLTRNGAITTYGYDRDRYLRSIKDAENRMWSVDRDSRDRISKVHSPSGATISYSWMGPIMTGLELGDGQKYTITPDANGHASMITNALGQSWTVTSDHEGLPTKLTLPGNATWMYQTDGAGAIKSYTSPLGHSWTYEHDGSGLLSSLREPSGVLTSLQRSPDLTSLLTTVNGTTQFGYNFLLPNATTQQVKLTDGNGNSWLRDIKLDMNATVLTSPSGAATTLRGSRRGGLTGIDYPSGTSATVQTTGSTTTIQVGSESFAWSVNKVGLPITFGSDAITYGPSGRPEVMNGVSATRSVGGRVTSFSVDGMKVVNYTYDSRGYVSGIVDALGGTTSVVYDDRGRLSGYTCPGGYGMTYNYNNDDQLTRVANSFGWSINYGRDNAGRITSIDRSDNVPFTSDVIDSGALQFDADGKLRSATYDEFGNYKSRPGSTTSYNFGAFGMKDFTLGGLKYDVKLDDYGYTKSVDASGTKTTWNFNPMTDMAVPIRSASPSSSWTYVGLPNGMILYGINDKNERHYYDNDGLGNIVAERTSSGTVEWSKLLTPYGATVGKTGVPGALGYQGAYGGLTFGDGRTLALDRKYYDTDLSRFVSGIGVLPGYPLNTDPRRENGQVFTYDPFGSVLGRSSSVAASNALRARCTLREEDYYPCGSWYDGPRLSLDRPIINLRPFIDGADQRTSEQNLFGVDRKSLEGLFRTGLLGYPKPQPMRSSWFESYCQLPIRLDDHYTDDPKRDTFTSIEDMMETLFPPLTTPTVPQTPQPDLQPKRETQTKK